MLLSLGSAIHGSAHVLYIFRSVGEELVRRRKEESHTVQSATRCRAHRVFLHGSQTLHLIVQWLPCSRQVTTVFGSLRRRVSVVSESGSYARHSWSSTRHARDDRVDLWKQYSAAPTAVFSSRRVQIAAPRGELSHQTGHKNDRCMVNRVVPTASKKATSYLLLCLIVRRPKKLLCCRVFSSICNRVVVSVVFSDIFCPARQ